MSKASNLVEADPWDLDYTMGRKRIREVAPRGMLELGLLDLFLGHPDESEDFKLVAITV